MGPAGAASNYLAYGTGMDFMYTQLGVPYALTYELYGSGNAGRLAAGAWGVRRRGLRVPLTGMTTGMTLG